MVINESDWEMYFDQKSEGFSHLEYENLDGEIVTAAVEANLTKQVAEIRRCNGATTDVKLYRSKETACVM